MPVLRQFIRAPLLHFLVIGCSLFLLFAVVREPASRPQTDEIVVTPATAAALVEQYRAIWRRPPTPAEMPGLIENHVREEVLLREAARLSLDQGDPIIRQRLVQKMSFLLESAAGALTPSEAELRQFFESRSQDYASASSVAFEQIFLGPNADVEQVAAALTALRNGAAPESLGKRNFLPITMPSSQVQAIDGSFGDGFFEQLERLDQNGWQGPVTSGYGLHLVRVLERNAPSVPEFTAVQMQVEQDWRQQNAAALSDAQYERLLKGYAVQTPSPEELVDVLQ